MTEDQFEAEIRQLIDRADLDQLEVANVLDRLAREQADEWSEREDDPS